MRYKYNILNYNLTNGLNEEVQFPGGFIYLKDATDLSVKIAVRPDSKANDAVYLKKQFGIVVEFKRLYITADAQPGKTVEIIITNSYDTFRIFEQAQMQDINSVASITNPVTIQNPTIADILKIGGTTQTGWDLQKLQKNLDAEYGTQIAKSNSANNSTVVLHTVTAGKTMLLEQAHCNAYNASGTGGTVSLGVRDGADVVLYTPLCLMLRTVTDLSETMSTNIIIPAGYDIVVQSNALNLTGNAFIKGREI